MKSFTESEFGHCPLVQMFCGRKSNNCRNHLHERALTIVYNDNQSSLENLLRKDRSVAIHHRNICSFAIKICKIKNYIYYIAPIMSELFGKRNLDYNLRSQTNFSLHSVNTVAYGLKSLKYFAEKIWNIVSFETTSTDKIFEKNSSFHVKQRTTGKVRFLFSRSLLLVLTKFSFSEEDWARGYTSMKF